MEQHGNSLNQCTAVIRLKDEAEWMDPSIASILPYFDKIVLCTQGKQTDTTMDKCLSWEEKMPTTISYHHYPHEVPCNGPGYVERCANKHYTRHHFYNWCFDKADTEYVCKWDGDMIALPELGEAMKQKDAVSLFGINLAGDVYHQSLDWKCPTDGVYKRGAGYYAAGPMSERWTGKRQPAYPKPVFLHTKWLKSEESITKAWPHNWRDSGHFRELWERRKPDKMHHIDLITEVVHGQTD